MKKYLLLSTVLLLGFTTRAQFDDFVELTIKTGICHHAKAGVLTLQGRRSALKKFLQNQVPYLGNCSLLMQPADQIVGEGKITQPPPNDPDDNHIWLKDPGEFIDLYNRSHKGHGKGEICLNSDGEVSFAIGTDNGSLTISSSGKFSLSAKSPSGVEQKVEF